MTELDDGTETPGWDWFTAEYEFAGLICARGATPEQLIHAFGADPAAALLLTADDAYQTFGSWVRVGQAGEWALAISDGTVALEGPALDLSAGTEVAQFDMGVNTDYFYFYADGVEVTSFEPLMAYDRGEPILTASSRRCAAQVCP